MAEKVAAGHDIIVIGGSAGAFEALKRICSELPADFPAAVFVVIHISPHSRSVMPDLLSRVGRLPARHPEDEEPIRTGTIYVAPPDLHMLLRSGRIIMSCYPSLDHPAGRLGPS
ncbi:MAG TPA: chemotaxis protein CheB [Acetobacteraceae bacterium]|nr:chemotaxis protein CheB [Acetobacteraceae bacterium]